MDTFWLLQYIEMVVFNSEAFLEHLLCGRYTQDRGSNAAWVSDRTQLELVRV